MPECDKLNEQQKKRLNELLSDINLYDENSKEDVVIAYDDPYAFNEEINQRIKVNKICLNIRKLIKKLVFIIKICHI